MTTQRSYAKRACRILGVFVLTATVSSTLSQEATVVVQGTVRRSDTLATIPGVLVRLGPPMRTTGTVATPTVVEPRTLATGPDGRFEFRNTPPGAYTLQLGQKGYFGSNGAPSEFVDLTLRAGQMPSDIDVLLDPGAQLSGRVQNVRVNLIPAGQ